MADLSDVCQSLVGLIAGVVYPNGTTNQSIAGVGVKVFEGWPLPAQLDTDIAGGNAQVSVFSGKQETPTTRYLNGAESVIEVNQAKITASVAGQVISLSGEIPSADAPECIVALIGSRSFSYAVQSNDTLTSAANGLAQVIAAVLPGVIADGATVVVPGQYKISAARVAVRGLYANDLRRQRRTFQITIWAPSPTVRRALTGPIDSALSSAKFLALPDQKARLIYLNSHATDAVQNDGIWRMDLFYSVDFATTRVTSSTTVGTLALSTGDATANI